ncbi:MAG: SH3 domain-containing protein [Veillonellales bacterium]
MSRWNWHYWRRALLCGMFLAALPIAGSAASVGIPNVTADMTRADFWADKLNQPDRQLLDQAGIRQFNRQFIQALPDTLFDLHQYPAAISKQVLTGYLQSSRIPQETMYRNDAPVTADYCNRLTAKLNLAAIQENNAVRYGFTVNRTSIRTFPTADGVFDSPGDRDFDLFQETILDPAEPVVILWQSDDNNWYFIQAYNYRGWVMASQVAAAPDREVWLDYMDESDFLTVTGNKLRLSLVGADGSAVNPVFEMGARLPLAARTAAGRDYQVKLPVRNAAGGLEFRTAVLAADADVVPGCLAYTRANILRQAFKLYGQRYGWGGLAEGVDCSSLILDVYRTFGFKLARNADEQENSFSRNIRFSRDGVMPQQTLSKLLPGYPLYMNGHVMLYIGEEGGKFYILHALSGYGEPSAGGIEPVAVMRVIVSDLTLPRKNGKPFWEAIRTAGILE